MYDPITIFLIVLGWGFPGDSDGKVSACNEGDQVQSLGRKAPLEKEMATHSSTLDWKIPWPEEPSRLYSMGSLRDWDFTFFLSFTFYFL